MLSLSLLAHAAIAAVAATEGYSLAHLEPGSQPERLIELAAPELVAAPKADESTAATPLAPAPSLERRAEPASRAPARAAAPDSARTSVPAPAVVAAPPAVVAAESAAPHFVMAAAAFTQTVAVHVGGAGLVATTPAAAAPLGEHEVSVGAKLLSGAPPPYPASAEAAGIEASVPVELVIDDQGSVRSAVATSHVGYGLDEAALAAVRTYRFAPARRDGRVVAVRMRWIVHFELR
jgi:protein TonB